MSLKYTNKLSTFIKNLDKASNSRIIRQHILTDANSIAPYKTGNMINHSYVDSDGNIIYDTEYATRQYYEHKTQSFWIERSILNNIHKYTHELIEEVNQ